MYDAFRVKDDNNAVITRKQNLENRLIVVNILLW